jgi:ABC-type transport system substrate-binding protein
LDATDVSGDQLSRVQGNKNITLHRATSQIEVFLEFNEGRPPFNNLAVRRAVAEAIDRKAVETAATQGLGQVSTSFVPPGIFAYDPGSAKYAPKLNLAAARAAIAAAHATGPYTLLDRNVLGLNAAAEVIQGELAQVGMQVNIVADDTQSQYLASNFDLSLVLHGSGGGDPDVMYFFFHSSQRNGGLDVTGMTDPTLDRLIQDGRTTLNLKKAKADYYQAQKILDTKVYMDPLWVPITVYGARSRVQGWHTSHLQGWPVFQDLWVK